MSCVTREGHGFGCRAAIAAIVFAVVCLIPSFQATDAQAEPEGQAEPEARCPEADRPPGQSSMHFLRSSVLCLVNRVREHHDLPLLRYNEDLRISATGHSDDMVANGYFSHYGPNGSTPFVRVARTGYMAGVAACIVGENLGWGIGAARGSPIAVVEAWLHSPPHRENILDAHYRDFGVGVSRGSPYGPYAYAGTYTLDLGIRH